MTTDTVETTEKAPRRSRRPVRGMGRIFSRGGSLWLSYYHNGEEQRESVAKALRKVPSEVTRRDAENLLKQRLKESGRVGWVSPTDEAKVTVEDLLKGLETNYVNNGRRSANILKFRLAPIRAHFGGDRARNITETRIEAFKAELLAAGRAPATVNRTLAALKTAFKLAVQQKRLHAAPTIAMLAEDNVRTGFFEADQFRKVLAELPEDLRAAFEVAYVTGWRLADEILTRQWCHVDFKAGWLRLEPGQTKNGDGRNFPLTPDLRAVLERQRQMTETWERSSSQITPWVFHRAGAPIKSFRRAWRSTVKRAGLTVIVERDGKPVIKPSRIPHDFRRTAVRNLERAGVPRSAAMKMVGHRTEAIYRRYAIADEGMLIEAGAKLAALHQAERAKPATVVTMTAAKG